MQSGAPICRLAARARRTSGKGYSGWQTPQAHDSRKRGKGNRTNGKGGAGCLASDAELVGWPTPAANEYEPTDMEKMQARRQKCKESQANGNGFGLTLGMASQLVGWTTPKAMDGQKGARTRTETTDRRVANGQANLAEMALTLTGWNTPTENDAKQAQAQAQAASRNLSGQAKLSSVETAKRGVLNPRFSLWLMGYPEEWACCGERAMQSCRKLPRASSKRS